MNTTSTLIGIGQLGKQILVSAFLAVGIGLAPNLLAQSDDFNDGNDNGWIRLNVLADYGGLNSYSFPEGPFGKAYRIQCNTSAPLAQACGECGTARTVVYRTNVYSDFYVAVDLVNWDNSLDQALVLLARASGLTDSLDPCPLPGPCPPGFGTVNGYICNYDCNQDGSGSGDLRGGQFQINRVDAEAANTLAGADVTLIPGKAYRITFSGVGGILTAQLYDLEDLTAPIVTIQANDGAYTSGPSGIIAFSREATITDVTFDNYLAASADPNADIAPAIRHPVAGTPFVLSRTPTKRFANLFPAAGPMSFNVNTFATNQIDVGATKLFLNGQDVSSSLVPSPGTGTNITFVTQPGLLTDNKIYSARIEVQDTSGTRKSTNTFWFDTFSNAFLTNAPVKTIEAEDYNYSNGVYQVDRITVSGIDTNGLPVNGNGNGYYGLDGTPDVDYHDVRTSTENGWNDYRPDDYVGTLQGNREDIQDLNHPDPTFPPVDDPTRPNDNTRPAYAALGLKEYEVARTEPGEWLNYTRTFADTNYYVYLRCGSFGVQDVLLDLVGGDPSTTNQTTSPLGTFSVGNHLMRVNYRYEPLTIGGAPVVVHLAGTNTLRLTIGGTPLKDRRLLFLNYLLFVPTSDGVTFSDNFNDGNDSAPAPAWVRYDPIQTGAWSFPGGNTYRIQSGPTPDINFGQGRAGSIKPGNYSDFYIAVDLVGWDDSLHQVVGLLARVNTPGPGTTGGYMFTHDRGNPTSDTSGDMDIVRLDGEQPTTLDPSGGVDSIHLQTNKQYRFVFMGIGPILTGQVYELPDTVNPVVNYSATDDTYTSGSVGLVVANNASETGYDGPADATFDNFLATTAEPRLTITPLPGGIAVSWPLIPFVLQTSPSLSSPAWTPVGSGITQTGNSNVYTVPTSSGTAYYRLALP